MLECGRRESDKQVKKLRNMCCRNLIDVVLFVTYCFLKYSGLGEAVDKKEKDAILDFNRTSQVLGIFFDYVCVFMDNCLVM